ncbi:MAG: AAA family ATPase [Spirulina sp. SIO3F2]|nr:AAA family ATPase [Spirulina sp. SIO3F2]
MNNPFAGLKGQAAAIALLEAAIARDRIAPAYLFSGPSGIGRTIAAQGFSQLLLSQGQDPAHLPRIHRNVQARNHPDLLWVEPTYQHQGKRVTVSEAAELGISRKAPPQVRIEQIREITEFLAQPPLEALRCVVVIEDAQTMAEAAANALLKTLEEPGRATLILIASSPDRLLSTLVSRCQCIPFYRLCQADLMTVLQAKAPPELLADETLMAIAQGSPGEALRAWQEFQAIPDTILQPLLAEPNRPQDALLLAKAIAKELELERQLWLLDYLQFHHWQHQRQSSQLEQLEQAKRHLRSFAQPRLVWDCLLLSRFN